MTGNPLSGHTKANMTLTTHTSLSTPTIEDGLFDGEPIISPSITNAYEGIHGNGIILEEDTAKGDGDRNNPINLAGRVNGVASSSHFRVNVLGGYAVIDGVMYAFAGSNTDIDLISTSAHKAGSPSALTSGQEALVVIYVNSDNDNNSIGWEMGSPVTAGTSYPLAPSSFLNYPLSSLNVKQSIVLATLRCVYESGSGNLNIKVTEINDKRVFIRPSPIYLSPVTSGAVAATDAIESHTALDSLHGADETGAMSASRFGAIWESYGTQLSSTTAPDNDKSVLYYSGTHAARFTRSIFDRVLSSTATSITLKSTDANILLLTPGGSATVTTSGSFPAGYIIEMRNLHASNAVVFARASNYSVAGGTLTRFVCTTSHATTPVFSVLSDDSIETVQIADNAVTTAKILNSNVTLAKIANIADDRVLGNISGSAAAPAELTAANLRTLLGVADGSLTTNDFTDADHSKLNAIEASATADQTDAEIRTAVEAATDSNVFTDADHSKLNGIEASATADQTDAEIRAAVEAAADSNVFTDADHSKLNGIEASADVTDTANVVAALTAGTNVAIAGDGTISATDTNTTYTVGDGGLTQKNFTTTLKNKLDGIEASATADQTDAEIRAAVEAAADSNVFTDADHSKLNGIDASADVTDASTVNAAGAIMHSDLGTKGDLVVGDGAGDATILGVGTNNHVLTADSSEASGVKWAASAGGITALTGDVTASGSGSVAATIAADAVTYAKVQNVASNNVLLGNDNGAGSEVQELDAGAVRTMLNVADGATEYTDAMAIAANTPAILGNTLLANGNVTAIAAINAKASKCFVYLSGDQTVSAGPNKVTHDTALWNDGSNYDTTNKYYVAPRDGYYLVACSFYFTSAPTWAMSLIYVDENAGAGFAIRLRRHSANGQDTHLSAVIKLSQNDKVAHYAQTSTNGTIGSSLNTLTYFQVTEML